MSKYTTQLRFICETEAGLTESQGFSKVNEIISRARPKIFDFSYPIFDEQYKEIIESKILKHYYLREIGTETYGVWKLFLSNKMNEIMPYYNKLYETEKLKFEPLYNYDLTVTRKGKYNNDDSESSVYAGNTSGSTLNTNKNDSNSENWNLYSDTPQGDIKNLNDETYLTNATKNIGENHESGQNKSDREYATRNTNDVSKIGKSDEDVITKYMGKQGGTDYADLLVKYRNSFLNIDMMVIDELGELFFNLW